MTVLIYLIPVALFLGLCGLAAFMWSLKSGQYDDLEGAANRILFDEDGEADDPEDDRKDGTRETDTGGDDTGGDDTSRDDRGPPGRA